MLKVFLKSIVAIFIIFLLLVVLSQLGIRIEPIGRQIDQWVDKMEQKKTFSQAYAWAKERLPKWGQRHLKADRIKKTFTFEKTKSGTVISRKHESIYIPAADDKDSEDKESQILGLDTHKMIHSPPPQEKIKDDERRSLELLLPEK